MKFVILSSVSPIFIGLAVMAFEACASPAILGGPTTETTQKDCGDGTTCAQWQDCPAPFSGGHCEAPLGLPPEQWGVRAPKDAGRE
jgi:hypothetical protein